MRRNYKLAGVVPSTPWPNWGPDEASADYGAGVRTDGKIRAEDKNALQFGVGVGE